MTENKNKIHNQPTITKLDKSRIQIEASIPAENLEKYKKQALKNLNEAVSIDGFRKGMVPENILISKVGNMAILEEMAELALSQAYLDILIENNINAVGKPEVHITKLAQGNPVEFKITISVVPEFDLPDYKKIAKGFMSKDPYKKPEVTDKDLDDAILNVRKSRVSHEGHDHKDMTPEEHEKAIMDSLPEFNDEFVRGLGDFENIEDFKVKVRDMIGLNKADEIREKTRISIADALTQAAKIDLPEVIVEAEIDRTQAQFEGDIEKMGVKFDDYIKHAKKSVEEIRKEWRPHAENKAKLQLILSAIARAEKIAPSTEEISNEVNHIVEHYKDADREKAYTYAETVLTNEKVFQLLEAQG